jgi:hypothetical protein
MSGLNATYSPVLGSRRFVQLLAICRSPPDAAGNLFIGSPANAQPPSEKPILVFDDFSQKVPLEVLEFQKDV